MAFHAKAAQAGSPVGSPSTVPLTATIPMPDARKPVLIYTDGGCEPNPGQDYYLEYYLYCPSCHTMYMVDDAKRPTAEYTSRWPAVARSILRGLLIGIGKWDPMLTVRVDQ